jgi:hypothetical protein
MVSNRIIARLDIKGESVVKGIQMDGLRKVGEPESIARYMSSSGADELLLVDVVAALYNRDYIYPIIEFVASNLRIPLPVVGGIRNIDNAAKIFDAGAEKIGINSMQDRPTLKTILINEFKASNRNNRRNIMPNNINSVILEFAKVKISSKSYPVGNLYYLLVYRISNISKKRRGREWQRRNKIQNLLDFILLYQDYIV